MEGERRRGWEDGGKRTGEREGRRGMERMKGWRGRPSQTPTGKTENGRFRPEDQRTHCHLSPLPSFTNSTESITFLPLPALRLSRVHRFLSKWKLGMKEESAGTADQGCFPAPCHGRAIRSDFSQYFHIPLPFFSVIPSTSVSETLARWVAS